MIWMKSNICEYLFMCQMIWMKSNIWVPIYVSDAIESFSSLILQPSISSDSVNSIISQKTLKLREFK